MEIPSSSCTPHEQGGLFEQYPTEILLYIIRLLPDLASLGSLLRASPVVYRIFDDAWAVEITEEILSAGYAYVGHGSGLPPSRGPRVPSTYKFGDKVLIESGATHQHVRMLINIVAHIRCSKIPLEGLEEFIDSVITPSFIPRIRMGKTWGQYDPPTSSFYPHRLPADTPPAVIRSILATARRIDSLSVDCLKFYLAHFKPIRPSWPAGSKKSWRKRSNDPELDLYMRPWRSKSKFQPVHVEDIGPPTWEEEQRVMRAFWRIQLISDLKKAAVNGRLSWYSGDIKISQKLGPLSVYGWGDPASDEKDEDFSRIEDITSPASSKHPENVEARSVLDYLREVHSVSWPDDVPEPLEVQRTWPLPTRTPYQVKNFPGSFKQLVNAAPGYLFFASVGDGPATFEPYRRLGFALWSEERLRGYGLVSNSQCVSNFAIHRFYHAWLSVLGPEDVAVLEARRKEMEQLHFLRSTDRQLD